MPIYNFDNYTTVIMNATEMFQVKYGTTVVYNKTLINFDERGGGAVSNKYAYYKRAYGTLPTTLKTGHAFEGWFTGVNQTGSKILSTTVLNSVIASQTLYAAWTPNTYTVAFNSNGGVTASPTSKYVTYASNYGTLATTSRTGHTFNGWLTFDGYEITSDSTVSITSNQTLYAQWTPSTYSITFIANGGTTPNPATKTVTYGFTYGTLATTSRLGYTFNGWFTASSGGTYITSASTVSTASHHNLHAQWTPSTYTVTWYKYGQSGETYAKRETLTYGSTSTAPTGTGDTTQYDYAWPKSSTTVVGTETITETRTTKSYTITWKSYTNVTLKSETLTYGSTSTAPIGTSDTTSYNYSWPKSSTTVVGTETITETRVGQPYTVTFNGNGGSTPSPTSKGVIYNNTYGTLATTSRTGYTFNGWFTARSGGTQVLTTTTVTTASNHTLYARWEISTPQTATPTLIDQTGIRNTFRYSVRNNDGSSATIYSDVGTNPPTTSRGLIASGASTTTINTGISTSLPGGVIYARAQASGKTMSAITSLYME